MSCPLSLGTHLLPARNNSHAKVPPNKCTVSGQAIDTLPAFQENAAQASHVEHMEHMGQAAGETAKVFPRAPSEGTMQLGELALL